MPPGADAITFSAGFVVATGLLHLSGIGLGVTTRWPAGRVVAHLGGTAIVVAGLVFLRAAT